MLLNIGTIKVWPAYIKFGFAIPFIFAKYSYDVLYSIAIWLKVSPHLIVIVLVVSFGSLVASFGIGVLSASNTPLVK